MAEPKGRRGLNFHIVELLVIEWIIQVQVHAINALIFRLLEEKLLVEVESISTDSVNKF